MLSLLELWYDEFHFQRWKSKRHGEFKVFNSIAQGSRFFFPHPSYSVSYTHLTLPTSDLV